MRQADADLWAFAADYRCITTNAIVTEWNGEAVMGAGCALEAKVRYPGLTKKLGGYIQKYGSRPFIFPDFKLITFPTKEDWKQKSILSAIVESAKLVVEIVDKYGIGSVAVPRPGCGRGGLSWEDVRPALEGVLDDRFTVVHMENAGVVLGKEKSKRQARGNG